MPEKLHIAHICPRFKEIHGGGEPVLFHLVEELSTMGIENTIATVSLPGSMERFLDSRAHVVHMPGLFKRSFSNVLLAGFFDLFCSFFLPARIPADADVICFHTENVVPALFVYKLLGGAKPTIYFCYQPPRFAYDTTEETARSGGALGRAVPIFKSLYRPFDRFTVQSADSVATFSKGYKKWIENIYDIDGVHVLPPGVARPAEILPLPDAIRKRISNPDLRIIVFVGKLVAWKNVDRLIGLLPIMKNHLEDVRLLVVGDGPCMASLQARARELHLEKEVVFCGYVESENVFSYCEAADLMVLLERNASFGLSIIEANSVGLPVLAIEGGGPSDIIHDGANGYLMPVECSDDQLAAGIVRHLIDGRKREEMKRSAVRVSEQYTWRRFAEMFLKLSQSLTASVQ